ncbi:hypothetical protein L218DRAFT_1080396 [Marasmius fiardii PR-910]|nr:hypothetical protein L218DRAFT_1080396 [Marasmius fiardii PR-910]
MNTEAILSSALTLLNLYRNTPNLHEDPLGWWVATDKITQYNYDPRNPLPPHHAQAQPDELFRATLNEDALLEVISVRRLCAATQLKDSQKFLDLLTYHDSEWAWVALGKEQQETLYLKAFQRDAENNPLTGALTLPGKVDAPELCRDALNKDEGRGFIELMKLFVLPDNDKASAQPFVLENKRFNSIRLLGSIKKRNSSPS